MAFSWIIDILIIFNDKKDRTAEAFKDYSDIKKQLKGSYIIKIL
jgi:hypothetical protein